MLDLSQNPLSHEPLNRLARCLSDSKKFPILRVLCLVISRIQHETLASIHDMLHVNTKLWLIHLPGPFWQIENNGQPGMLERQQINDQFQQELIPSRLPLHQTLEFLSVLHFAPETPRVNLDSFNDLPVRCW